MKKKPNPSPKRPTTSVMERFGMVMLKKLLFYGTIIVTGIIGFSLIELEEKYKIKAAGVMAIIVFVIGLSLSFFTVPGIIGRMERDKALLLSDAIVHTFYSYLLFACFLPIIGPFFGRILYSKNKKNPFTQDTE